jgi:hypothetical protein
MVSRFVRQPLEDGAALETMARNAIGRVLGEALLAAAPRYRLQQQYVTDRIVGALLELSIDTRDLPPLQLAERAVRPYLRSVVGEAALPELVDDVLAAWCSSTGVSCLPRFDVEEMHPTEILEAAE